MENTLDEPELSSLESITNLTFDIKPLSQLSQANSQTANLLLTNPQVSIINANSKVVSGYLSLNDFHSKPLFVLTVLSERTAYQQALWVEYVFLASSIAFSVAIGSVILVLLEVSIIKPLKKMSASVKTMPFNQKLSENKSKFQTEEIEIVSNAVEDTLNKKFEAMNDVSKMVAHDLRNPLAGIKNSAYILRKKYSQNLDENGKLTIKMIENCVDYSDKIVQDLLDFSSKIKLDKVKTTPKKLIDSSLSSFIVPSNIQVINESSDIFLF